MAQEPKYIVVIGTSAGGVHTLNELVAQLKPEWDAAYFIILHLSRKSIGDFLVHRLQRHTALKCDIARSRQVIQQGHIYVAVPNTHLIIKLNEIRLGTGPEENRWKPSIDVLFRSAAAAYDGRVVGIVLTGLLDDGTAGMSAIKRSGGTLIVQDPNEADFPDMPLSVLNHMEVDYCVSISEMGAALSDIIERKEIKHTHIPPDVAAEAEIAEKMATGIDVVSEIAKQSVYTCPDCGGGLWSIEDGKLIKYRCNIGHAYSEKDLLIRQAENVEATLWVSLRMMEERKNLLRKMEEQTRHRGFTRFANEHKQKGEEIQIHIDKLKRILSIIQADDNT